MQIILNAGPDYESIDNFIATIMHKTKYSYINIEINIFADESTNYSDQALNTHTYYIKAPTPQNIDHIHDMLNIYYEDKGYSVYFDEFEENKYSRLRVSWAK